MKNAKKISEYVEGIFDQYGMDKYQFFFEYNEEKDAVCDIPLFPNGEPDAKTLDRISTHLGITQEEILAMDPAAAERYWVKYAFFPLYNEFVDVWRWHAQFRGDKPSYEELLLNAIFGGDRSLHRKRYNLNRIRKRMIDKLKEIDQIIPGTFHENAEITNFKVKTETIVSFPQCTAMVRSFLGMVERLKILFYRAIKEELPEEDRNELNFLASYLNATDTFLPSTAVTYDTVRKLRTVYEEEQKSDFYDYVRIRSHFAYPLWRCQEFFDDMGLVQEYENIFPETKGELRQFAMLISKFYCEFIWSDAKPITFPLEQEQELLELDLMFGEDDLPLSERVKEPTHIYIDKTPEEIGDDGKYVKRILDATAVSSKGGLSVPRRKRVSGAEYHDAQVRRVYALRKDGDK